jgi:hypothetical protein
MAGRWFSPGTSGSSNNKNDSHDITEITNFTVFGLIEPGLDPTIYRTRDKHANYYTIDAVNTYLNN